MNLADWNLPPKKLVISNNDIHTWLCEVEIFKEKIVKLEKLLSIKELEKANKFHFSKDRNLFVISHSILRIILSNYTKIKPENIKFISNKYGKPFLLNNNAEITFNLSHSSKFCLIGIAKNNNIGVDIEQINGNISSLEIAKKFFSENEYAELLSLPENKRNEAFCKCWTRKEAYIKAVGKGLSINLNSFDVTITEEDTKILRINNDRNIHSWQLYNLPINNNYCAAVTLEGKKKKLTKIIISNLNQIKSN